MDKLKLGQVKAIFDRQKSYLVSFNFLMVAYLFFDKVGFEWWYLLIIPFWFLFSIYDIKYIWPSEMDYVQQKGPVMKLLKDRHD